MPRVAFNNRVGAQQLTASLDLGAESVVTSEAESTNDVSSTPATAALAVTSGSSGSQGDYTATSPSQSGTWQASPTGSFTYSYPIDVPSAIGGNAPAVSLDYDSQSQDGETSARNSQSSWIGDGWDYQPGFVQRSYRNCGLRACTVSGVNLIKGTPDE